MTQLGWMELSNFELGDASELWVIVLRLMTNLSCVLEGVLDKKDKLVWRK